MNWDKQFAEITANTDSFPSEFNFRGDDSDRRVTILDIGCGYGGLIFALANMFPDDYVLGMEIRDKVVNYVAEKILAIREETPGQYEKTSVIKSNAMKHLPNFFEKE